MKSLLLVIQLLKQMTQRYIVNLPSMVHFFKINMVFLTNEHFACYSPYYMCSWSSMNGKMEFPWLGLYPLGTKVWIFNNG